MSRPHRTVYRASYIVLLTAAVLRLAALGSIPPGLPFEEASLAGQALHPPAPLTPGPGSQWITYLMSGSLVLFGQNLLGIRLAAVLCGLLTVVITYRWARLLYPRRVALVAAALLAISFWPLFFSRIGLGAVTLPPLLALANWLFARGLSRLDQKGSSIWLGLAGLAAGAALYSPPGGWLVPAVFAGLYIYFAFARRDVLRSSPVSHLAFWIGAILAGLPLAIAQAGVSITPQMSALADSLARGDTGPSLDALGRSIAMWAALGDGLFHYNVGFWPVFNAGLAIIFVVGLFYPVSDETQPASRDRALQPALVLVPAWLVAGVIASALIDPERPFTMGIIAMPATYMVLALGLELIGRLVSASGGQSWLVRRWGSVAAALVILAGVEGAWSYFVVGPNDPQAQGDYRTDLFTLAHDLRTDPQGGSMAIGTNPPENIPPLIFEFLPHGDRPVRWFDAGSGLLIPASANGSPAEIDIPEVAQLGPRLERYLGPASTSIPRIRRYTVPSGDAFLAAFPPPSKQNVWVADAIAFPPNEQDGVRQAVSLPTRFGDVVELVGTQSDATRQAGKTIRVTLFWRILRDADPSLDLSMFAHLLAADGTLAAQIDALAVTSATWRAGDILIQIEDIATTKKLGVGLYHLQIGLYGRADNQRLPVMVNGSPAGNRLLLEPVTITAP